MSYFGTIDRTLNGFAEARANARRFHAEDIGKGVDPSYCFGDFLVAVKNNNINRLETVYRTKTALSESAGGVTGGYLVPQELRDDLMVTIASRSIFRPRALVVPMKTATLELPLPDASTAPTAVGTAPYYGGLLLQWLAENTAANVTNISETEPLWRQVALKANELAGYAFASNALLQDAGKPFETALHNLFADAAAWYEDWAFFQGNGTGKPTGVINSPASYLVTRGTPGTFTAADAQNMTAHLLPQSWERAFWVMHPTVIAKLTAFSGWFPNGPLLLFGLPVIPCGRVPTLGTQGDVCLIDPALYVIGDRQELEISVSVHYKFLSYQTVFMLVDRVDGQPWLASQVTLADTSTKVSPFVILQ